jgi:para-nitrobenzyl esterase
MYDGSVTTDAGLAAATPLLAIPLLVAAVTLAGGPALAQVVEKPVPRDPITIKSGLVAGKVLASGVRAYFGIPYAAPPLRELRWREPQPVAPWKGVYYADRLPPQCPQTLRASDINHYFGEPETSEDCLYISVWAPPTGGGAAPPYPVLVWVYGGRGTTGSSAMANYGREGLARKGVVYVGFNYRVGALGSLALPELTSESPRKSSGNYAYLDMVAALQWINRNIASFGGDPANVTVMGQSFGSMAVGRLQVSPLARGLIQKAVGMSGGPFERRMKMKSRIRSATVSTYSSSTK